MSVESVLLLVLVLRFVLLIGVLFVLVVPV